MTLALLMKRILFSAILLLAACFAVLAQTDFDEPKWTVFEPVREEFTLNFPGSAVKSLGRDSDDDIDAQYHVVQNKTYFAVFSRDNGDDTMAPLIKELAVEAVTPKDIEIDGIKGQRYDFKGSDDYEHSFIAIQATAHFYVFHAFGETRDNPLIEEFLKSIRLNRQVTKAEKPPVPAAAISAGVVSAGGRNDILKPSQTGGGMGSAGSGGPGPGMGAKPEDTVAPPKYAKVDSGVTILAKPRPGYTDMARRYMVSGTVRLRVTFEKNAQIGSITALAKLPLGLTQKAISAARQIKFSPAVRRGEPYSVVKVVEFSFILY